MTMEIIIWIVGGSLSFMLAVNSFLLAAIFRDVGIVKVSIASLIEKGNAKERRIQELEENQKILYGKIGRLERGALH